MQLIKLTNPTGTEIGTGNTALAANSVTYSGFSQGAVRTDANGQITHFRVTNGEGFREVSTALVEVGILADNGRFCVHLTSRHGRT